MRTCIVALCTALALGACGGGSDGGGTPTDPDPVDPDPGPGPTNPDPNEALRGTWAGPLTATVQGAPPIERQASIVLLPFLDVFTNERVVNVRGLCPGVLIDLRATGAGRTASWTGTFSCSPTPIGDCTVTVTYGSLTFTLNADDTLAGQGAGTVASTGAASCAGSAPAAVAFTGTRQ